MGKKTKTYNVQGKMYDVPEQESAAFLKSFPDASEMKSYIVDKDTFDVPITESEAFLKDNPNATETFGVKKKDEPSEISTETSSIFESPSLSQQGADDLGAAIASDQPEREPLLQRLSAASPWLAAPINYLTGAVKGVTPYILDVMDGAQKAFYRGIGTALEATGQPGLIAEGINLKAEQDAVDTWWKQAGDATTKFVEEKLPPKIGEEGSPYKKDVFSNLVHGFGEMTPMLLTLPVTPNPAIVGVGMRLPVNFAAARGLGEYGRTDEVDKAIKEGAYGVGDAAAIMLTGYGGSKAGQAVTRGLSKKLSPQAAGLGGATTATGAMGTGGYVHSVASQIASGVAPEDINHEQALEHGMMFTAFGIPGILQAAATTYAGAPREAILESRKYDADIAEVRRNAIELEKDAIKEIDPNIKAQKAVASDALHKTVNIKAIDELMGRDPEAARKWVDKQDLPEAEKAQWMEKIDDSALHAEYKKQIESKEPVSEAATGAEKADKPPSEAKVPLEGEKPPTEPKPYTAEEVDIQYEPTPRLKARVEHEKFGIDKMLADLKEIEAEGKYKDTAIRSKDMQRFFPEVEGDKLQIKSIEDVAKAKEALEGSKKTIEEEMTRREVAGEKDVAEGEFVMGRKAFETKEELFAELDKMPRTEDGRIQVPEVDDIAAMKAIEEYETARKVKESVKPAVPAEVEGDAVVKVEPPKKPPKPPKEPPTEMPAERVDPDNPKEVAEMHRLNKAEKRAAKGTFREKVLDRKIALNLGAFDVNKKVHDLNKVLKPHEREAVSLLIEEAGVPEKLKGTKTEEAYNNPSPEVKKATKAAKKHFDDMWQDIVKNTDKLTTDQIENYVTHIWDIPKNKMDEVVNWFSTKNRFLKKRFITTLKEGMDKFDLTPKTLDIGEIMKIHSATSRMVIENNKFLKDLKEMDIGGMKAMAKAKDAPEGYVEYKHPALTYKKWLGERDGKPITADRYYKVHPDMKRYMDVIFGSSKLDSEAVEKAWQALENTNNWAKKTALSASLFHHGALTETALPTTGLKALKNIGKDMLWDSAKSGFKDTPAFKDPEIARRAIEYGTQIGASNDFDVAKIQKSLDQLAKKTEGIPGVKWATKGFSEFNRKWDRALWEYLHDGFKIYAFEHLASRYDNRLSEGKMTPEQHKKVLRETAQVVNDTYGGQNWDVLLVSPMAQRIMRTFMLSPDWTISTIRQALAPTGLGALYKDNNFWKLMDKNNPVNARRRHGTAFWLKAALIYGTGMNLMNSAFRREDIEENPDNYTPEQVKAAKDFKLLDPTSPDYMQNLLDYTMIGNTVGHKTHLFTGRYDDDSETYMRWGKQFREMPELFLGDDGVSVPKPMLKKIGGKMSPVAQLTAQAFTGKTMSGYENYDLKNKEGWNYTLGLMKTVAKAALPYSSASMVRGDKEWGPSDLIFPRSKGMTPSKAISLFTKGIEAQDEQFVSEIYDGAVRNNLDAYNLFTIAMSQHKATLTRDAKGVSNDISEIKQKIKEEKDPRKKDLLEERIGDLLDRQEAIKEAKYLHDQAMDEMQEYTSQYSEKWGPPDAGEK